MNNMEQNQKQTRSNDQIMQGLSWDMLMRRRSSMSVAELTRRSSLLSVSLFDLPLLPGGKTDSDGPQEMDPFAPFAINEGFPMAARKHSLLHGGHHMMTDRSESSVPSLSNSSASSYSTHGNGVLYPASVRFPSMTHSSPYDTFVPSPLSPIKQSLQLTPHRIMSSGPYPPISKQQHSSQQQQKPQHLQQLQQKELTANSLDDDDDDEESNQNRFKPFHEEKWTLRYKELLEFHKEHGHSAVPHTYPKNPQLARWVKRQRRQYKLRRDNRPSTMTAERLEMLSSVGFIWDSHDVNWREKLDALQAFKKEQGHCNVPSNYTDKKLATWVKCQRRQYKLYWDGKPSAMSPERILELEKIGFEWEIRATVPRKNAPRPAATSQQAHLPTPSAPTSAPPQPEDFNLIYQNFSHEM